jgi:hypothetical protein
MGQDLVDLYKGLDTEDEAPGLVHYPPMIRGKKTKVLYAFKRNRPTIRENMVRIETEADPVGLLIAIANGTPIASFHISENGDVTTKYETPNVKLRIQAARSLLDKVMPKVSVQASINSKTDPDSSRLAAMIGAAERDHDESGNSSMSPAGSIDHAEFAPADGGSGNTGGDVPL